MTTTDDLGLARATGSFLSAEQDTAAELDHLLAARQGVDHDLLPVIDDCRDAPSSTFELVADLGKLDLARHRRLRCAPMRPIAEGPGQHGARPWEAWARSTRSTSAWR